jgi:hypothetical protein
MFDAIFGIQPVSGFMGGLLVMGFVACLILAAGAWIFKK